MNSESSGDDIADYLPSPPMSPRSNDGSESSVYSGIGSFVIPDNDAEIKTLAAELAEAELKSKRAAGPAGGHGMAGAGSSQQHAQQAARSPPPPATRVRVSAPRPRMNEKARKQAEAGYVDGSLFNSDNYASIAGLKNVLNTIKDARTIFMLDMSTFDAAAVYGSKSADVPLNNADVKKLLLETLETTCAETIKLGPGLLNKMDVGRAIADNKCVRSLELEIGGADLVTAAFNVKNALENPRIQALTLIVPQLGPFETNSLFWTVTFPPNLVSLFLTIHGKLSLPALFALPPALHRLDVGVRGGYREVGQLLTQIGPLTVFEHLGLAIELDASTDGAGSVAAGFAAAFSNKRRLDSIHMHLHNFVGLPETDGLRAALRSLPVIVSSVALASNIYSPFVAAVAESVFRRGWKIRTDSVDLLKNFSKGMVARELEIDISADDVPERALNTISEALSDLDGLRSLKIAGARPVAEAERFITDDRLSEIWKSKISTIHMENIPFRSSHIREIVRNMTRNRSMGMDVSLRGSIPDKDDAMLVIAMAEKRSEFPFKTLNLQKSSNTTFFTDEEGKALKKKFKRIETDLYL